MSTMSRQRLSTAALVWLPAVLALVPVAASAADMRLGDHGIVIAVKGMGDVVFGYPVLQPGALSALQVKATGKQVDLTYAGDIGLRLDLDDAGMVTMRFSNVATLKAFTIGTRIGLHYIEGGNWSIGTQVGRPFPAHKPETPQVAHIFQGHAGNFIFVDGSGRTVSIGGMPEHAYQDLKDLRAWNDRSFSWKATIPVNSKRETYSLTISDTVAGPVAADAAAKPKVLVDRFGQTTTKDFPGKVGSEADLQGDVAAEAAYWATYKPLAVSSWGGLPGTKERLGLQASGFFRVERKGDKWLLVDPDGDVVFHLGVCVMGYAPGDDSTLVKDRREIFEWLPPVEGDFAPAWHPQPYHRKDVFSFYAANVIRKYGKDSSKDQHLGRMVDRLRAVGFNAVGAFTAPTASFAEKRFPRMAHTGFGPALPGIRGVADPFDDESRRKTEEGMARSLRPNANDPLIIGYFFGNEQAFEDIPRAIPRLPGKHAAKRKLVEILRATYPTIEAFNAAWAVSAASHEALVEMPLPVSTRAAFADMQAYTELFLDEYFKFVTGTFRKYDQNHLMVGTRLQPHTANNEAFCRAAGRYMDIISINFYGWGVDRTVVDRVHAWTGGRPQMWSEFFFSASPESNAAAYNRDMPTQRLRGEAYRQYIEHAAATGYVVGTEWFSLVDQAVTGRWFQKYTGERTNNGLFNVCDRPYDAMLREMAAAHASVYGVLLDGKTPHRLDDPRVASGLGGAIKEVQAGQVGPGSMRIDGLVDGWPGRPPELFSVVRPVGDKDQTAFEAAFKVAWDASFLYVLVNVTDPTPMNNRSEGDRLWQGDGIELFIGSEQVDRPGTLLFTDRQILLGAKPPGVAGATHVVDAARQPDIAVFTAPAVDGTGYTLEAAIPWAALDATPSEGAVLLFDIAIDDAPASGGRTRQAIWNGGTGNSGDRSRWGRLRLVP